MTQTVRSNSHVALFLTTSGKQIREFTNYREKNRLRAIHSILPTRHLISRIPRGAQDVQT